MKAPAQYCSFTRNRTVNFLVHFMKFFYIDRVALPSLNTAIADIIFCKILVEI